MHQIKQSVIVPYTQAQMYELINRVEDYPKFLPWCSETIIHSRTENEVKATIVVAKGAFKQSFGTVNRLNPPESIEMKLLHGPFRHLEGVWRFEAVNETQCRIDFDFSFEFSNKLMSLAMGPYFKQATNTFLEAFQKQASILYG